MCDDSYKSVDYMVLEKLELGVDAMIKKWCTHALMSMLLKVALELILYVKWTLVAKYFCQRLTYKEVVCEACGDKFWDMFPCKRWYAFGYENLGVWPSCQKPLVLDRGGFFKSLYLWEWAIALWPFDPSGQVEVCCC